MLRRSFLLLFLPLGLGVWLAPFAAADTVAQARKAIQADYDREDAAAARKDVNGTLANMAPGFHTITPNGLHAGLPEVRQGTAQMFQRARTISARTTIQKLTLKGNQAVVTVKEYETLTIVPKAPHAHPHKIVMEGMDEDTWVKHGNRWLKETSRQLSVKQTLDGKPIP